MQNSVFIGFIQNIAFLLSFSLIYDYFWARDEDIKKPVSMILTGGLIGLIAVLLMMFPWSPSPGVGFDSRTILLSISGLFFGPVPTVVAMIIAAVFRIIRGGDGVWMGVAIILSSGIIGMIWRIYFPPRKIKKPYFNILILGLVVHIVMLACSILLPVHIRLETFKAILLPVLTLYAPGTMLLGMLMLKRWQIWQQQKINEKEESRYRHLFETAGEAILVAQEGFIKFANKRLSDMLERDYEEIRSVPFTEFIHPDDREFVLQRHRERMDKRDVPRYYSFRLISRSGQVIWVEINSVYTDWEGKPSSLSFLTDVTSQRETSRQLVLAKNKAEESDRLKTIFLANMSHEIRTPMNAIIGFSDLLNTDALPKDKRGHYVHMIQAAGSQLLSVINDVVDTSKLEVNQLSINNKHCLLKEICEQSLEVVKNNPLFKEKDLEIKSSFPEEHNDLLVNTDPFRIRQVADNLLSNAVKYSNKGLIELTCDIMLNKDIAHIEIHVKDNGKGIPINKKEIIFERFRQVEENQYREGAGLGLSIAKGIVELMGGKIGFSSEEGKGSDFYFTMDLEKVSDPEEEDIPKADSIPDLEGVHIMVAEDDLTSFYLIREYLLETKATIAHAADGEILLNMMKENVPDLVLLDINMPNKDGYECLKEILQNNYKCKVIAQTAYAMQNEKEHCLNSGCHGYVSKPIDPDLLINEVKKVLNK